jgi:uncharacterized protein (TIGR00725 family)
MPDDPAPPRLHVAVIGPGDAHAALLDAAEEVGRRLGEAGATIVCGGLGGVMEAACRGARSAGAPTIGLLPGEDRDAANPWVSTAIPTGLGELRNGLVVRAADAVVAVGGAYGTLSEIALALRGGLVVVGVLTTASYEPPRRPRPPPSRCGRPRRAGDAEPAPKGEGG